MNAPSLSSSPLFSQSASLLSSTCTVLFHANGYLCCVPLSLHCLSTHIGVSVCMQMPIWLPNCYLSTSHEMCPSALHFRDYQSQSNNVEGKSRTESLHYKVQLCASVSGQGRPGHPLEFAYLSLFREGDVPVGLFPLFRCILRNEDKLLAPISIGDTFCSVRLIDYHTTFDLHAKWEEIYATER